MRRRKRKRPSSGPVSFSTGMLTMLVSWCVSKLLQFLENAVEREVSRIEEYFAARRKEKERES